MTLPDFLTEGSEGEIVLTGHRIGLYSVVRRAHEGLSAEQIADAYPSLPLDHVRKVIAFSLENKAEVDAYVEEYGKDLERQEAAVRPVDPAKLRERFVRLYPERAKEMAETDPTCR